MTPVTPYTNTDAIRGCLGVTDNELLDEMIVDSRFALQLEMDLEEWLPGHASLQVAATAASDAVTASQLTLDTANETLTASETTLDSAGVAVATATSALATAQANYDAAAANPPVDPSIEAALQEANLALVVANGALAAAQNAHEEALDAVTAAQTDLAAKLVTLKKAQRSFGLLVLYSMWFCAVLAVGVIRMAAPKKNTNGKDAFERFVVDMDNLAANAEAKAAQFRAMLSTDQGITPESTSIVMAGASTPAYDPMTNEGFTE